MNPKLQLLCIAVALYFASPILHAQVGEGSSRTPFDEYPKATSQIFVYDQSLFAAYKGPSVARANVPEYEERSRIGIVTLAPKVSVYVDRIDNLVHGPAFFELTDVKSGVVLATLNLGLISPDDNDAKLLFNGQGVVYLHYVPSSVCFGRVTRKFVLNGKRLIETKQALAYLGADAQVYGDIKLFSSPDGAGPIVAALQDGAKVSVIGIAADSVVPDPKGKQYLPTLLLKSPLGLTGWYVPERSIAGYAGVTITQCN